MTFSTILEYDKPVSEVHWFHESVKIKPLKIFIMKSNNFPDYPFWTSNHVVIYCVNQIYVIFVSITTSPTSSHIVHLFHNLSFFCHYTSILEFNKTGL